MASFLNTPAAWPKILLERALADDPTDLDEAVRAGAFTGLRKAIRDLGETGTLATIAGSGLRGRGGGGLPAAAKRRGAGTPPAPPPHLAGHRHCAPPPTRPDPAPPPRHPLARTPGGTNAA